MHQGLWRHLRSLGRRARHRRARARRLRQGPGDSRCARSKKLAPTFARYVRVGDRRTTQEALIADGLWSQYLEVAIGPDAEVFTKSPVLSAVGWGDWIGVRSESQWNNPEPEIVLACDARGRILGAALGNDVNLRDIEGRSALLWAKPRTTMRAAPSVRSSACSMSASGSMTCAAPWSRYEVHGADDYRLEGSSSMSLISRDLSISFDRPWTSTTIRTASCCSSERCSRRRRTATRRPRLHSQDRRHRARLGAGAQDAGEQSNDVAAGTALDAGNRRADAQPRNRGLPPHSQSRPCAHTVYPSLRDKRVVVTVAARASARQSSRASPNRALA